MISVIIPTFNEEAFIKEMICHLRSSESFELITEIIVVDGGSTDKTVYIARDAGADQVYISEKKGRSAQMNFGASHAKGSVLYFLHADTLPPTDFAGQINIAITSNFSSGCFTLRFDHPNWFLKANSWLTRFDLNAFRFGDQSLFVSKTVFVKSGGFSERHFVLEDQEIIERLKTLGRFRVIQKPVITSARKYLINGIYKTQGVYVVIYLLYKAGVSQQRLLKIYRQLIRQDK